MEGVFWAAHEDVKAGVNQYWATGLLLEAREKGGLVSACEQSAPAPSSQRVVNMGNGRDFAPRHVELVNAEELFLVVSHPAPPLLSHVGYQQNMG